MTDTPKSSKEFPWLIMMHPTTVMGAVVTVAVDNALAFKHFVNERTQNQEQAPTHPEEKLNLTIPQLVAQLDAHDVKNLYIGEGSHLSKAVQVQIGDVITAKYKADPDTIPFRENPEAGKGNDKTFALLRERSKVYNSQDADIAREAGLYQNGKIPLNTDSWLGPDHHYEQDATEIFNHPVKVAIPGLFTGKDLEALKGVDRDIAYRNTNMAHAISSKMLTQTNTPFLFSVGEEHLERKIPHSVPNQLDTLLPGEHGAVLNVFPVADKSAVGIYKEKNQPADKPIYEVMVYDAVNGYPVHNGVVVNPADNSKYDLKPLDTPKVATNAPVLNHGKPRI